MDFIILFPYMHIKVHWSYSSLLLCSFALSPLDGFSPNSPHFTLRTFFILYHPYVMYISCVEYFFFRNLIRKRETGEIKHIFGFPTTFFFHLLSSVLIFSFFFNMCVWYWGSNWGPCTC
jgi:hypothetical protein